MTQDLAALAAALRTQRQIDMDGCEVAVSRQACDAAADALEAQAAEIARLQEELAVSEATCEGTLMILAQLQAERDYWCGRAEKAEAAMSESQALLATAFEVAAQVLDTHGDGAANEALSQQLCCSGQMCGCQGADVGLFLQYLIRALTPADAQAALDARINAAREEGLRLAAKICTRGDDRAAILAKIKEAENG